MEKTKLKADYVLHPNRWFVWAIFICITAGIVLLGVIAISKEYIESLTY